MRTSVLLFSFACATFAIIACTARSGTDQSQDEINGSLLRAKACAASAAYVAADISDFEVIAPSQLPPTITLPNPASQLQLAKLDTTIGAVFVVETTEDGFSTTRVFDLAGAP